MRIDGYDGLVVAKYFELPTVKFGDVREVFTTEDETKTMQMPVIMEVSPRTGKRTARFFQEEAEVRQWIKDFDQHRRPEEKAIIREQPLPLGRLRINIGLRYDVGRVYISLSPYPDCQQLLSQGIVPAVMEFSGFAEVSQYKLYELVHDSGIRGHILGQIGRILFRLLNMYFQGDFLRIQVAPLIITLEQEVLIGGISMEMDDDALSRQEKIIKLLTSRNRDQFTEEAEQAGLVYRTIDPTGNVGVVASGMGLALSSLDYLVTSGLLPYGCLILGSGLSEERMTAGVRIMTQIPNITGLLINLYGGVNSCEIMAKGIVNALDESLNDLAVVVKMGGHDQEEGWRILEEAGVVTLRAPSSADAVVQLNQLARKKKEIQV